MKTALSIAVPSKQNGRKKEISLCSLTRLFMINLTSKNSILVLFLTATMLFAGNFISAAQVVDKPLTLSIFPRLHPKQTNKLYKPLAKYLSKKLGKKIILKIPRNFSAFWLGLESGKYDIVHFNQYHYVKSHKNFGYDVIVKNIEFNESTIAGSIIVRKDSGINKISDLKGKNIVFGGGPRAMQSYIVARHLLQQGGLNPGDYKESFATNPPNAIMSTFYKQSSASGSGDKVLRLSVTKKQIDTSEMRFLVRGEQMAHLPWAVKSGLPDAVKLKIQTIFLNINKSQEGIKLLKNLNLDGFTVARDSDYNPHRAIIKKVLNEKY